MTESRRNTITKVLAVVIALILVVAVSAISRNTALKATEEGMAELTVEEQVDEKLYEPEYEPVEEPVKEEPVVETEVINIEEIEEVPAEETPIAEEELVEEEPIEEEPIDRELPEEEEEEPLALDVVIWYEFPEGNNGNGSTLVFMSSVSNAPEWMTLHYRWQYDRGAGWEDIPGADGAEYVTELTAETGTYQWRLLVTGE